MNRAARAIRDNARIPYGHGLRIAERKAALRVFDSTSCSSLGFPFCASDTRLLGPEDDPVDCVTVYDCLCPACLEANPNGKD